MTAPINGTVTPPALYTVEQLELIRRLRNSGISREDVANAFDTFDRLDRELGPVYNIPVTLALQAQALQLMALGVAGAPTVLPVSGSPVLLTMPNASQCSSVKPTIPTATVPTAQIQPTLTAQLPVSTSVPLILPKITTSLSTPTPTSVVSTPPSQDTVNKQQLMEQLANSVTKSGANGQQDSDINEELVEFMKKGEVACCEEIKAFAVKHNIKQQQIAVLAGICQSYVSRYMKGDIYDMSERSRHAILKWYLIYRKNPAAIAVAANAATLLMQSASSNGGPPPPKKFLGPGALDFAELASNAAASGDLSFPRRERFVFRPTHLEVLEKYFQDNNYPSFETREEIAQTCNQISESAAGRVLTEREKVSSQIISNWFANKRKELKKLAREEGLMDVGLVPMRPRGHPSRLYSDLALIQQYRNGISGNTGGAAAAADAAVTSSSVELSSGSVSPHGGSECDERGAVGDRRSAAGVADVSSDDLLTGDQPLSSHDDEDHPVNWSSVEMVAVNQAILSLTGQQPINVSLPPGFLRSVKPEINDAGYHDSQLETPPPTVDSA